MVICLVRVADLHMAQLMPLPFTGFAFLVLPYMSSPGQRAIKWVCVRVIGLYIIISFKAEHRCSVTYKIKNCTFLQDCVKLF